MRCKAEHQKSRATTSWPVAEAVVIRVWAGVWLLLARWTPKFLNGWRLILLRIFGAKIFGRPFVFSSARIYAPFNVELHDAACVGPNVYLYSLGRVILREGVVISHDTMLCGGGHDLTTRRLPLMIDDIEICNDVFVGTRALILPGVKIGVGAVVGAGSVVSKSVEPWQIVAGNPARRIGERSLSDE